MIPTNDPTRPGYRAKDWTYRVLETLDDDTTRITLLSAAAASTQGRGITHLVRPQFQIITTRYAEVQTGVDDTGAPVIERAAVGGRAMTLRADSADMEMDGNNKPQRGLFRGDVRVTLLEAEGQAVVIDPADPRFGANTQVRQIFIDGDTRFGLDTNEVRSEAPVHVTSAQADFYGIGLVLKYNTTRQRIEQLVVQEGRYLMYDPQAPGRSTLLGDNDHADTRRADTPGGPSAPASERAAASSPSQFYLATFADHVVVRDTDRAILGGDEIRIRFSLGTQAVSSNQEGVGRGRSGAIPPRFPALPVPSDDRLPGPIPGMRLVSGDLEALPSLPPPFDPSRVTAANRGRSLYTAAVQDSVVITWTGPLRLVPLEQQPDDLVDEKDVAVAIRGDDAFVQSMRDGETHRVLAAELSYTLASEFVTVIGDEHQPLAIYSSNAGTLTTPPGTPGTPGSPGARMTVDLKHGTATLVGPGTLVQQPDEDGKQLVLAWSDRMEMALYTEQRDAEPSDGRGRGGGQTRITGIRTATFHGDVTAQHPDFDLAADQLAVAFDPPDPGAGLGNNPSRIEATLDVAVVARGNEADERFDIQAQSLVITLDQDDDGKPYARSMRALADVRIARPGSVMTCHRLDVALDPSGETQDPDARFAQVRSVLAVGEVRAEIQHEDRHIRLAADHLLGDIATDRLTLYATEDDQLVEIVDVVEDRLLRGRHVVMDDQAQVVRIEGPGALVARMDDPDHPPGTPETPGPAGNPQAEMSIGWQHAMRFNNATGKAEFHGEVAAVTRRNADTTELSCDDLEVWFTQAAEEGPAPPDNGSVLALDAGGGAEAGGRDVRRATATGNVRFVAATRAAETPDRPHSRVTLTGPRLVFTNQPTNEDGNALPTPIETVVVTGQGWMLIEDYTPEDAPEAPLESDRRDAQADGIQFSGQGQTAFLWEDRMELDARANTARFEGAVQMAHDPTPDDRANHDNMHMNCARLTADMEDTGGLGVWMSDAAPQPEISVVTAQGPLRIVREGREIRGDHLRYVEADQLAEIWADPSRDVILQEPGHPAPARCGRVLWDLAHNRIEMRDARGGVTPAGR